MSPQAEQLRATFGERLQAQVPLARHTSFRVGGPAEWLLRVDSVAELLEGVSVAQQLDIPCQVLGGGSNVLVSDAGVAGLVLLNRARQSHLEQEGELHMLVAESGVSLPRLAGELAKQGIAGMEWGTGVPGTVGGAIVQNAGAWGVETKDRLLWVNLLERSTLDVERWPAERLAFRYRHSALLELPPHERPVVLRGAFRLWSEEASVVSARTAQYREQRTATQPRAASGGSTFRNPPGDFAGRLIEAAGLKGHRIGAAQFSPLHANFIVHDGSATAEDVRQLIELAQRTVAQRFDVHLQTEVEMIGAWPERVTLERTI